MLKDKRSIMVNSPPENVFSLIETMPNKFPIYKVLETKPFFFLRLLLVNGFQSAVKGVKVNRAGGSLILKAGDSMGPFTLTQLEKPFKYWFTLKSLFFNCRTGYTLTGKGKQTVLSFDLIFNKPSKAEKLYWFLIKPFHIIFAKKVLRIIKEKAEHPGK